MGEEYEVLERSQQKREESGGSLPDIAGSVLEIEDEMINLYHSINSVLPDVQKKVIQFISSRNGEGSSTMVREFARVVSLKLNKLVLLLGADRHSNLFSSFDVKPKAGWDEVIKNNKPIKEILCQDIKSRVYISQLSMNDVPAISIFSSHRVENFFKKLKHGFDLILIDSPSFGVSTDGIALSDKVDGVILVVEAEKTRWQIVLALKDSIINRGGKILGVIINKKKYYIPKFIYDRL